MLVNQVLFSIFFIIKLSNAENLYATTNQLIDSIMSSIRKSIEFFEVNYKEINLDGISALKMFSDQIRQIHRYLSTKSVKQNNFDNLVISHSKLIIPALKHLTVKLNNIVELAQKYLYKYEPEYYKLAHRIMEMPWSYAEDFNILKPKKLFSITEFIDDLVKDEDDNFSENFSDNCIGNVLMTSEEIENQKSKNILKKYSLFKNASVSSEKNYNKNNLLYNHSNFSSMKSGCQVNDDCLNFLVKPKYKDYAVTHQILFMLIIKNINCTQKIEGALKEKFGKVIKIENNYNYISDDQNIEKQLVNKANKYLINNVSFGNFINNKEEPFVNNQSKSPIIKRENKLFYNKKKILPNLKEIEISNSNKDDEPINVKMIDFDKDLSEEPLNLVQEFCSNIFYEISAYLLYDKGGEFHKDHMQDLFLEQVFVCSIHGFFEFLHIDWLTTVIEQQQENGCWSLDKKNNNYNIFERIKYFESLRKAGNIFYKKYDKSQLMNKNLRRTHLKKKNNEANFSFNLSNRKRNLKKMRSSFINDPQIVKNWTMRKMLYDKILEDGCSSHYTAVALVFLSQFLRFILISPYQFNLDFVSETKPDLMITNYPYKINYKHFDPLKYLNGINYLLNPLELPSVAHLKKTVKKGSNIYSIYNSVSDSAYDKKQYYYPEISKLIRIIAADGNGIKFEYNSHSLRSDELSYDSKNNKGRHTFNVSSIAYFIIIIVLFFIMFTIPGAKLQRFLIFSFKWILKKLFSLGHKKLYKINTI